MTVPFKKALFWDVCEVDVKRNRKFIIERVLNFGDEKDFQKALKLYGQREIAAVVLESRNLDKKSQSFGVNIFISIKTNVCPVH